MDLLKILVLITLYTVISSYSDAKHQQDLLRNRVSPTSCANILKSDVHSALPLMTVRAKIWCKFCVQSVVKETPQIFSNSHILSATFRASGMCKRYD